MVGDQIGLTSVAVDRIRSMGRRSEADEIVRDYIKQAVECGSERGKTSLRGSNLPLPGSAIKGICQHALCKLLGIGRDRWKSLLSPVPKAPRPRNNPLLTVYGDKMKCLYLFFRRVEGTVGGEVVISWDDDLSQSVLARFNQENANCQRKSVDQLAFTAFRKLYENDRLFLASQAVEYLKTPIVQCGSQRIVIPRRKNRSAKREAYKKEIAAAKRESLRLWGEVDEASSGATLAVCASLWPKTNDFCEQLKATARALQRQLGTGCLIQLCLNRSDPETARLIKTRVRGYLG